MDACPTRGPGDRGHDALVIATQVTRRLVFALALLVGGALAAPDATAAPARGSALCKKKKAKKAKAAKAAKAPKAAKAKKVTAKTIKGWQKKGLTDEEIVKLAAESGYAVTKKETKRLKKLKVRPSLMAALSGAPAAPPAAAAPKGPQPIDIGKIIDPNDIDFDSVPPPQGMDMRYADAHRAEKGS